MREVVREMKANPVASEAQRRFPWLALAMVSVLLAFAIFLFWFTFGRGSE